MCLPKQVSVYGARGPLVPHRARAGQLVTPGARARPASVDPGVCVGPPPTGHLPARARTPTRPRRGPAPRAAPPTAPTRPANWPPPSPTARSPARLPLPLPLPLPPLLALPPLVTLARAPLPVLAGAGPWSYNGARARLSARYEGARAGPTPLDLDLDPALAACLPACLPAARASDGPSPTHTHRPRPARNRACKRSRVRKSFRGEAHLRWQPARLPRGHVPRPTGHRPSSPGGGARGSLLPVRARARPSRPANWRRSMEVEVRGNRSSPVPPRVSGERCLAPLQAPGAAGPQQGYLTAYTTRLVTSVVCRGFIPARGDIAIRQPAPGGFSPGAVASLLRCMARRPIRIQLRRAGLHRRVPARILT
ncbi:hypothetical protein ALT_4852 [Aspergillus lentulus]|uniref:Uncharacterized protein n=1 Tax=Aspergillus lentulus TaxID=293939 RepID=A0AAN4PJL8_ASPLE|nr:hypothetical protein ALT_4852 [Aspergillus lentulus]